MTGYAIKIVPAELVLGQPRISAILMIMTLTGILFIALSLLAKYKVINPPPSFFNLFMGMGIIFTAGSLIFMTRKIPESIAFNKEKSSIIFSENGHSYSKPFSSFSRLLITGKISNSQNGSSTVFQLNLISRNGSGLLLCESEDKELLKKTAETIISYIDIDLLSGGTVLHKANTQYSDALPVYPPENAISIKSGTDGNYSFYRWHSRKSLTSVFLLGAVIFGFNFLIFVWAFPEIRGFNIGLYAGSAVVVLIDIFFIATLLFSIFGSSIAEISDKSFSYRQNIFGFTINSRSFSRDEISMISSGFTSDENRITLFTAKGVEILNELKIFAAMNNLNDTSMLMTLVPKVMELRSNIIEIDGTPLYYYEKLYLENEWSAKLKLRDNSNAAY